jgi:hypothetical protein
MPERDVGDFDPTVPPPNYRNCRYFRHNKLEVNTLGMCQGEVNDQIYQMLVDLERTTPSSDIHDLKTIIIRADFWSLNHKILAQSLDQQTNFKEIKLLIKQDPRTVTGSAD